MANKEYKRVVETDYQQGEWVVNVETGRFWHKCNQKPAFHFFASTRKMGIDCYKKEQHCPDCNAIAPQLVFERLYQAWRSWNWGRKTKPYVSEFYISGFTSNTIY